MSQVPQHVRGQDVHAAAFPTLSQSEIDRFRPVGDVVEARDGDVLVRPGDANYPLMIVLDGALRIVERRPGREELVIARHGTGEFLGDVDLLTGRGAVFTAVAEGNTRVLRVDRTKVRAATASDAALGERLLRAMLVRRDLLADTGYEGIRLVGSRWSKQTHALKELLDRNAMPYTWADPEADPATAALLESMHVEPSELPILLTPAGDVLRRPSPGDAAEALGLRGRPCEVADGEVDLLIVGGGPAGLAAAVYAASEGLSVLVVDAQAPGGQAGTSSKIENYPGFPTGIGGGELARRVALQAQKFGATIRVPCDATSLTCPSGPEGAKRITLDSGEVVVARTVMLSVGARYRKLGAPGEAAYAGTGVYYGATQMEAAMCRGRTVIVVGGGNSAGQAAVFLSGRAERVLMLVRGESVADTMSRYLIERLEATPNVELRYRTRITALVGDAANGHLDYVLLAGPSGEENVNAAGVFVMIGADPCTEWLDGAVALDDRKFILTGNQVIEKGWPLRRAPMHLETSLPGVFAAGDARSGSTKRVATAVGEGAMAVSHVHAVLAGTA